MRNVCFACGIQYVKKKRNRRQCKFRINKHKTATKSTSRLIMNQLLRDTLQVLIFLFLIWHCVALTWWFLIIVAEIWINADASSALKHNTLGARFLWLDDLTRCTCVARLAMHVPYCTEGSPTWTESFALYAPFSHLYSPVMYKIKTFQCLNH